MVLNGDHGADGGDAIWCRGGDVLDEVRHPLGRSTQAQDHLAGQSSPSDPDNRLTPRRSPGQGPVIHLGQFVFQRWHHGILPPPHVLASPCSRPIEKEVLTRKAVSAKLALHGMKNETKRRLKAALIAALIATAILALGLAEEALGILPNH